MRFGFVTCVQLGLSCMEEIHAIGGRLDLALTLPDDRARAKSGRVYLDTFCGGHGIPLVKVSHINDAAAIAAIRDAALDWLFIIGWSQIAGVAVLAAPRAGTLGMHPTLLPEGRGRAAIPWAILKGLSRTGVTLFRLAPGVDTGPVAGQVILPLAADETATTLYARVGAAHRELIRAVWPSLSAGTAVFTPQDESQATTWPGRTPADGLIRPTMTVAEVDRLVRATTHPYPGAFAEWGTERIRVWRGAGARPGAETPPGALPLPCVDGVFLALDYAREPA